MKYETDNQRADLQREPGRSVGEVSDLQAGKIAETDSGNQSPGAGLVLPELQARERGGHCSRRQSATAIPTSDPGKSSVHFGHN